MDACVCLGLEPPCELWQLVPCLCLCLLQIFLLSRFLQPLAGQPASSALMVTNVSVTPPELPPVVVEVLPPVARETLRHCYADHHNVRDILLVVNFNDWNAGWAPSNVQNLLKMHGASFPGIVVYSSKEHTPEITQGIPELNMFFCPGGGGNSLGLKAQMCTGLALTAFEGHIGYLIISERTMQSGCCTLNAVSGSCTAPCVPFQMTMP
jgi:hypothetical protein